MSSTSSEHGSKLMGSKRSSVCCEKKMTGWLAACLVLGSGEKIEKKIVRSGASGEKTDKDSGRTSAGFWMLAAIV